MMAYSPQMIMPLLDVTRLNSNDSENDVSKFCQQAKHYDVAAVCVLPKFIEIAKEALEDSPIKVATVINFPHGNNRSETCQQQIDDALSSGADELDIVLPYKQLQAGNTDTVATFLNDVIEASGTALTKCIMESGQLSAEQLHQACELAVDAGFDFLKTSTGKTTPGATLEAANIMLQYCNPVGIKFSGGIRQYSDVTPFLAMVSEMLGRDWIKPSNVRFGASQLLTHMVEMQSN